MPIRKHAENLGIAVCKAGADRGSSPKAAADGEEEHLARIWNRFYKVDESRNRAEGGTGIGLSLVKAIMKNYDKAYGAINKEDGVEFYFELELEI